MKCCKNCVHCIPDPLGTKGCTETGLVCDVMAPMIYCCVSEEDYHGEGDLNRQCGDDYEEKDSGLGDDSGYCGTCCHCDGVDDEKDVCICRKNNPHADWRNNPSDEKCPEWEA